MSQVLGLDKEDPEELPEGAYAKPTKIYTLRMEDLGKKPQTKKELAEFIKQLPEVSEKVKKWHCRKHLLEPIEIFPEENDDPRKS